MEDARRDFLCLQWSRAVQRALGWVDRRHERLHDDTTTSPVVSIDKNNDPVSYADDNHGLSNDALISQQKIQLTERHSGLGVVLASAFVGLSVGLWAGLILARRR